MAPLAPARVAVAQQARALQIQQLGDALDQCLVRRLVRGGPSYLRQRRAAGDGGAVAATRLLVDELRAGTPTFKENR